MTQNMNIKMYTEGATQSAATSSILKSCCSDLKRWEALEAICGDGVSAVPIKIRNDVAEIIGDIDMDAVTNDRIATV